MPNINAPTPDATTTTKGKVQLAGDLAGTSALPVVGNAKITPSKLSLLPQSALVATSETTTSTTYVDLTTTTDTVTATIGANGVALVSISCLAGNGATGGYVYMSFAVSGATTISAGTYEAANQEPGASASSFYTTGCVFLVTGLTAGSNTFKTKYKVNANTGTFQNRRIAVVPL